MSINQNLFPYHSLIVRYVCIVFYPMDFVYAESIIPFSNRVDDFAKLNCAVMALSTDSVYSHKAFVKASK